MPLALLCRSGRLKQDATVRSWPRLSIGKALKTGVQDRPPLPPGATHQNDTLLGGVGVGEAALTSDIRPYSPGLHLSEVMTPSTPGSDVSGKNALQSV